MRRTRSRIAVLNRTPKQKHIGARFSGQAIRDDSTGGLWDDTLSCQRAFGQDPGPSSERTRARSRIGTLRDDYVRLFRESNTSSC